MKYGKIVFINTKDSNSEHFGNIQEVNSNFNFLISLQITQNRALGLTKDNDLIEWIIDPKYQLSEDEKKIEYFFLLQNPIFLVNKIKFSKIHINSTVSMGINFNGIIFVWGSNKDGLLGLGYTVTDVETPTELMGNIKELSISENHAVAIDFDGEVFSWGCGKYGELCLDKRIYCPFPAKKSFLNTSDENYSQTNFKNVKIKKYRKVFCSDLLTCFIDEDGRFSYYGVIIKIFKGTASTITIKSLLKDENNSDPNILFQEKFIYELENEKFLQIVIGNGFLGLLSEKGLVYTIDHSDNITLLYTKYCVYSIGVSNNQLFGLCKNSNGITTGMNNTIINSPLRQINQNNSNNKIFNFTNNISNLNLNKTEDEEILANLDNTNHITHMNYFLCRWLSNISESAISDAWSTQLFKINTEETELENMYLMNSNNKDVLFIMQLLGTIHKKASIHSKENDFVNFGENNIKNVNHNQNSSFIENKARSFFRDATINNENRAENFNVSTFLRKNSLENNTNPLCLLGSFDDSYNLKYKRVKNNYQGVRVLSLDKKKEEKNETEEISDRLNNSIRKKRSSVVRMSALSDPFHISIINNDKSINNEYNNLNNTKNKLFKMTTISNGSAIESNVNYILSPDLMNMKEGNNNNTNCAKKRNSVADNGNISNQFRNSQGNIFNLHPNFNNYDEKENDDNCSNEEKGENKINFPANFSQISEHPSSPSKNLLRRPQYIFNENDQKYLLNEDDYIKNNNLSYNFLRSSVQKKHSDNTINKSSFKANFEYNANNIIDRENSSPNPYRNKTNHSRKSDLQNYNKKNFGTNNKNSIANDKVNIFKNNHINSNKNNIIIQENKNTLCKNEGSNLNQNKVDDEGDTSNNSMFNKSHNLYKNQKLNLSPNQNEIECDENNMNIKINNRNSAEIPKNLLSYKRNKNDENKIKSTNRIMLKDKNQSENRISEKNDLNDSIPLDENKIKMDMDIETKIKNYNKTLTYHTFMEEKQVLDNIKDKKKKFNEKNYSNINEFYSKNEEKSDKYPDSPHSLHRKFSLEKRIREFKNKISSDMNENSLFVVNVKPLDRSKTKNDQIVHLKAVNKSGESQSNSYYDHEYGKKFSNVTLGDKTDKIQGNANNQINQDFSESCNMNVMSTNRTLNSQVLSKNNLVRTSTNFLNFNNNAKSNNFDSRILTNNFNTLSPKENTLYANNTLDKLKISEEKSYSQGNLYGLNYNLIRNNEDYLMGFEQLENVLISLSQIFSPDLNNIRKIYFEKLMKFIKTTGIIRRTSRTMSNKSSRSGKSMVSDRYNANDCSSKEKTLIESKEIRRNSPLSPFKKFDEKRNNTFSNLTNFNLSILNKNNLNNSNSNLNFANKTFNGENQKQNNNVKYQGNFSLKNFTADTYLHFNSPVNNKKSNNLNHSNFLKYPTCKIKEKNSEEEKENQDDDVDSSDEDEENDRNSQIMKETEEESEEKYNESKICSHICSQEILYLAKITVKIISLYYKQNKKKFFQEFIIKSKNKIKSLRVAYIMNKSILNKHYFILDRYFSMLKSTNQIYKGVKKLSIIFGKFLHFFFDIFGHKTRVLQLKKKYLEELMVVLTRINIRQKKYLLLHRISLLAHFKRKLPFYDVFLSKIFKITKKNFRRIAFTALKKYYFSIKNFERNMEFFTNILYTVMLESKRKFFEKFKVMSLIKSSLRNLVMKKHIKRMFFMKKGFKRFMENSLNNDDQLYMRIKLKKCLKIYAYMIKLQSVKYLYRWKNCARFLSKFIKNSEKPVKYNINTDLKSLVKKPSKIPGFNNFALNNSFNNLNDSSRVISSPRTQKNNKSFQIKFDKNINIYRFRNRNSLDIIEENPSMSINNNFSQFNNLNQNNTRRSLENSIESNKNKTQITFVCNNDIHTDDKGLDLQHYLLQGNHSFSQIYSLDSPGKNNINLPLSTDQMQTGRKSIKSISSSVKNTKYVTPKFVIKDSENESSAKKNFSSINTTNSKNKSNLNVNNNMENTSLCRTGSITNVNNLNSNNSNLHVYLPVQSPILNVNHDKKIMISKDDSIRLGSFNLTGNNSILGCNITNNIMSNAYNPSGNSLNNLTNKGNHGEKEINIHNNYFKDIMEAFKEKTSLMKNKYEKNNMSLNENFENNLENLNNHQQKIHSGINYIEGSRHNILINSISGKIKFETGNNSHLKYRRNKHNSINFKENNLMQSFVTGPTLKTKVKKYKSHSITNFPISPQESKSLNYEYNFPFNDQHVHSIAQQNLTSNTNSNIEIINKNKNLVYSSCESKDEENQKISSDKNITNSRNIVYSSFNSKGNVMSESNNRNNTNTYINLNEKTSRGNNKIISNEGIDSDDFNYLSKLNSQKSIFSNYENDANIMNFSKNINISNNNSNNHSVNQNHIENLKKEIKKNIMFTNQNYFNFTYNSGNYGYKISNFTELQRMNYQNNLLYLINVLNEKILTVKHKSLNQIMLYSEEVVKNNRRYALKMIVRIFKRRFVFIKLKFLSRLRVFSDTLKEKQNETFKSLKMSCYKPAAYEKNRNILVKNESFNIINGKSPQQTYRERKNSIYEQYNIENFDLEKEMNEIKNVKNKTATIFIRNKNV